MRSPGHRVYSTKRWQKTRAIARDRYGNRCAYEDEGVQRKAGGSPHRADPLRLDSILRGLEPGAGLPSSSLDARTRSRAIPRGTSPISLGPSKGRARASQIVREPGCLVFSPRAGPLWTPPTRTGLRPGSSLMSVRSFHSLNFPPGLGANASVVFLLPSATTRDRFSLRSYLKPSGGEKALVNPARAAGAVGKKPPRGKCLRGWLTHRTAPALRAA